MILLTKSPGSPQTFQEALMKLQKISAQKFQGRNPYNIFVAILVEMMTPKRHFEVNWPLLLTDMKCILRDFSCGAETHWYDTVFTRILFARILFKEIRYFHFVAELWHELLWLYINSHHFESIAFVIFWLHDINPFIFISTTEVMLTQKERRKYFKDKQNNVTQYLACYITIE